MSANVIPTQTNLTHEHDLNASNAKSDTIGTANSLQPNNVFSRSCKYLFTKVNDIKELWKPSAHRTL